MINLKPKAQCIPGLEYSWAFGSSEKKHGRVKNLRGLTNGNLERFLRNDDDLLEG